MTQKNIGAIFRLLSKFYQKKTVCLWSVMLQYLYFFLASFCMRTIQCVDLFL